MDSDVDSLKKDFCIIEDLSDIQFMQIHKENYKNEINDTAFGEKLFATLRRYQNLTERVIVDHRVALLKPQLWSVLSLVHNDKTVFGFVSKCTTRAVLVLTDVPAIIENTEKGLETSCEVLKLDLRVEDEVLEKEIAVCRNFLQRHRNLNSTFLTLKKLSRFYESRRLIINIVLKKEPRISLNRNEEGALCVKYTCDSPNILIEICWKVEWDLKNCDILDFIEVYYNNFELPNSNFIKDELKALTHHSLDFSLKLKLWKQLIDDLSKHTRQIQATVIISDSDQNDHGDTVLVISDSDDDRNQSEETFHRSKRRKVGNNLSSSKVIHVAD